MSIYSQLMRAQLQNSASDLSPTSDGLVYFDTTTKKPKIYAAADGWKKFLLEGDASAVEKTMDSAAGTSGVTLGTTDEDVHVFTPSSAITVKLNNTYLKGRIITIVNDGTNEITLTANDDTVIATVYRKTHYVVVCSADTPAINTSWFGLTTIVSPEYDRSADFSFGAGFGTTTEKKVTVQRVGNELIARGWFRAGTVGTGSAHINLPSGIVIDSSSSLLNTTTGKGLIGTYHNAPASGSSAVGLPITFNASDYTKVYPTPTYSGSAWQLQNGETVMTSNSGLGFQFRIPVSGWATNRG